ncbi:MAG: ABC transporter permease [Methylococcales bacterium]|nr:ABC transporter permease [Methylococcales bacterium]
MGSIRAVFGSLILCCFMILAIAGGEISGFDPMSQDSFALLQPPSSVHYFGTDNLGRDVLSRLISGTRITLLIGVSSVAIAASVGFLMGLLAGYRGGKFDSLMLKVMDGLFAIPSLLIVLTIVAILGSGMSSLILGVAIANIPHFSRITRGEVLVAREASFIEALSYLGIPNEKILLIHIIPAIFSAISVQITLRMTTAIWMESAVSFLGLGPPPPTPSWGSMISEGRAYLTLAPWISSAPGMTLSIMVFAILLVGDALREKYIRQ